MKRIPLVLAIAGILMLAAVPSVHSRHGGHHPDPWTQWQLEQRYQWNQYQADQFRYRSHGYLDSPPPITPFSPGDPLNLQQQMQCYYLGVKLVCERE